MFHYYYTFMNQSQPFTSVVNSDTTCSLPLVTFFSRGSVVAFRRSRSGHILCAGIKKRGASLGEFMRDLMPEYRITQSVTVQREC